ncbi:MAG: lipid-A-disaccharide synthase [Candidatus Kapabacteria bacterium]|nr:lipid-A-disaccharide synthase [Candidatus Kapabacteria bacterium]
MIKKVFISAGEQSGDLHASKMMRQMKSINNSIQFFGIGGELMQKEGLNSLADIKEISVVGFWEVAKKILFFKNLFKKCKEVLLKENIQLFIPVDYPGFNIKLAGFSKSNGVKVVYYIAPQLWAWGKNRAIKLKESVDKLLVVFPFEVDYFKSFNIDAIFVGHPLLDNPEFQNAPLPFEKRQNMIAILPGSRPQELKRHLPIVRKISSEIKKRKPEIKFGTSLPENLEINIKNNFNELNDWEYFPNSIELMQNSIAGIIKAGTTNLEAALCGLPFALFYQTSFISYFLGKKLINLPYLSIVNILHQERIIEEYIQSDINPVKIAGHIINLIESKEKYNLIQNKLIQIRQMIGEQGASRKAAEIIMEYL